MSDNYAVINGKRVELTDEQVKALGIKRVNPFKRVEKNNYYYYVRADGHVDGYTNADDALDNEIYTACNHFTDEAFAKQVALHQLFYRKLLKFAYDNNCEDTAEWDGEIEHWCIYYGCRSDQFDTTFHTCAHHSAVYFSSDDAASRAIKEVVEPFMKENPDFVW